jgi:hypothetical protein
MHPPEPPLRMGGILGRVTSPSYYSGKKDQHKRLTTENTDGHGKEKSVRMLFSVYFREFRG